MSFKSAVPPERGAKVFEQLVLCLMRGKGNLDEFLGHVAQAAKESEVPELLKKAARVYAPDFKAEVQRAAVAAGTTSDGTWASPLVAQQTLASAFLESLRFSSMLDDLAQDVQPWRPGTRVAVNSGTAAGASSLEATWKPLTKADWTTDTVVPHKAHALVVVTNETLFASADGLAENAIRSELRRAVSVAADNVIVPILTNGLTPIACTGNARGDLADALGAINLGQSSRLHMYLPSKTLKQFAMLGTDLNGPPTFPDLSLMGGSISGMPVMPIDALSGTASFGDAIVIVDASQLAGFAGTLTLNVAKDGSLWFDDTGTGTAAKSMTSLFQTSSTALRLERWFACERPRAASVAVISNASY